MSSSSTPSRLDIAKTIVGVLGEMYAQVQEDLTRNTHVESHLREQAHGILRGTSLYIGTFNPTDDEKAELRRTFERKAHKKFTAYWDAVDASKEPA